MSKFVYNKFQWKDLLEPIYIERKTMYDFLFKESVLINRNLKNKRIMDFGCGNKPYKELFRGGGEYIGVDVKESGHDSQDKSTDIFYDKVTIPLKSDYFDYVLATQCFEHIPNIYEILLEINRVMKKEGILLATVPMVWEDHELPFDYYRYTENGLKYLLEQSGYAIIRIKKLNNFRDVIGLLKIQYAYKRKQRRAKFICILENIKFLLRMHKNKERIKTLSTCIGVVAKKC